MVRIAITLVFGIFMGCAFSKKSVKPEELDQTEVFNSTAQLNEIRPPDIYHASKTKYFDLIHTRLDVHFDWENALLHGKATLTCKPTFYPQDTLILDAKGMIIHSVYTQNHRFKFDYNQESLCVILDKTYHKSDTLLLKVEYTAQPDLRIGGGSQAITGDKGLYFINPRGESSWKMPQIWTQGETESNSVWFPTLDSPNQKMTQDLHIRVDRKYTTLSNGILVESKFLENNQRVDHWQQKLPHAPYLTMMGVGEFVSIENEWTRKNGEKVPVHFLVEHEWKDDAALIFGNTLDMLSYFSKVTGYDYPWEKYHQIIVRDYVSGAMENTGAVVFGDMLYSTKGDLEDQNWDDIIAHELAHHWFGDLVTCESWSNLPLNESFATYFEVLWDEYKQGKNQADYHVQTDKDVYFNSTKFQSGHHDLIWFDYFDKEQMFDGHSYSKGSSILHMLRGQLGDEAFFEGIKHYLNRHQFGTVEAHDLRLAFEHVTGQDLNWFFNQWFFAKGHPILELTQEVKNDSVYIYVAQNQDFNSFPIYKLPTKIRVWEDNLKPKDYAFLIEDKRDTLVIPIKGKLQNLILDPEQHLLLEINYDQPDSLLIHQLKNSEHYYLRKIALKRLAQRNALKYANSILESYEDPFFDVRLEAINQSNRIKKNHENSIISALVNLVKTDSVASVRFEALIFLNENYPSYTNLLTLADEVVKKDISNNCRSEALRIIAKLDPTQALAIAKTLELEKSSTIRAVLAELYASNGFEEHFQYFSSTLQSGFLRTQDRKNTILHLGKFLSRIKNSQVRSDGISIFNNGDLFSENEQLAINFSMGRVLFQMESELKNLNEEIQAYERTNDYVWVQRLKKDRDELSTVIDNYNNYLKSF